MSTTANFKVDPRLASIPASGWVALERSTAIHRDPANARRRFIPLLPGDCALPDTLRRDNHFAWVRHFQAHSTTSLV